MEMLKKYFPYAFKQKGDIIELVVSILIHLIAGVAIGVVFGLLGAIPFVGIVFSILGWIVDLYIFVDLILAVLDYFKLLKN